MKYARRKKKDAKRLAIISKIGQEANAKGRERHEMKVREILDTVCGLVCDTICKYPDQYPATDEGQEKLLEEHCENCPLVKYI